MCFSLFFVKRKIKLVAKSKLCQWRMKCLIPEPIIQLYFILKISFHAEINSDGPYDNS